ncbi:unnamed protein product [Dracunculus medinensis]|uniref:Glutathione synthetase n=1 Tax=Dracunculus medinensis TaxID=318479 RepID=A0A0N4ULK7_DRAME|nr:unnamed protein product [Dracunculus medinensis]
MDNYPVKIGSLSREKVQILIEDAIDWAHGNGMVMRKGSCEKTSDFCQFAPFTLFPTPFPRKLFEKALEMQQAMNLLYFRISWDYEFLVESHREVIKTDAFTRNLIDILKIVRDADFKQSKMLLIQRSDYMFDGSITKGDYKLRQIEVNNIAVSMGALAERTTILHRRVLQDLGVKTNALELFLPLNRPIDTIAGGLYQAWLDFGIESAIVLTVIENEDQNRLDQRHVEYRLDELSKRRIKCVRLTLTECGHRLYLSDNNALLMDNQMRISLVYFRTGYSPENYASEFEWNARRKIELSDAIKCPCIGLQVANTKKVQQVQMA